MKNFKFYSFNLNGGNDTQVAANFYHSVFGWKINSKSQGHSELQITDSILMVLSRPTENCPVTPGTLTLVTDIDLLENTQGFRKDPIGAGTTEYTSYLDPWENRIWLYKRPNIS
jgi:hypothetical protein